MNRIATFSVIAALSAVSFGEISHAASVEMNWPAHIDQTVRTFRGDNFRVVDLDTLKRQSDTRVRMEEATANQRAALLAAIEANKPLAAKLRAQNVETTNIAGAEQAADGGLTIDVR